MRKLRKINRELLQQWVFIVFVFCTAIAIATHNGFFSVICFVTGIAFGVMLIDDMIP